MNDIAQQVKQAAQELLAAANLHSGDIVVVGCSSSEVIGSRIGTDSVSYTHLTLPTKA